MIIKFRDNHIANLEKANRDQLGVVEIEESDFEKLRKENKSLQELLNKNIDSLEYSRENRRLKG